MGRYTMLTTITITLVLVATACGSSSKSRSAGGSSSSLPTPPTLVAAAYTADITNPWFPLRAGSSWVSTGTRDDKPARDVVTVTNRTEVIDGVPTRVVEDSLYLDGKLAEATLDYYTQDNTGAVWYFGEDTKTLDEHGKVTGAKGTWRAGVDGAHAGIYVTASPAQGQTYTQEYYKGHAEDHYRVVDTSASVTVPYGSFRNAVLTEEWTPLEPDALDHKYYARGVGQLKEQAVKGGNEQLNLVEYTHS